MIKSVIVKDVFETYTYFYIDDETKHGFLIDPGAEAERLLAIIAENGWTIERILLTHGHFDHTGAVEKIHKSLQIPYYTHENGKKYLENTKWNLSTYCKRNVLLKDARLLQDGDEIFVTSNENFGLKVMYTPGHTSDSVIFYSEKDKVAFVGDTIFKGGIGSTQYPGSNPFDLENTIINRIFKLPQGVVLYPGHSEKTTVGIEKARYIR